MTLVFDCKTVQDTQKLAEAVGRAIKGGQALEFKSDLGGGKTTFIKGLAKGMGVKDVVQSPSFTISFIHPADRDLALHHFDFYRLHDAGIMANELQESLQNKHAVVAIEWGDIVHNVLPDNRITVNIVVDPNNEGRHITLEVPAKFTNITDALKAYKV